MAADDPSSPDDAPAAPITGLVAAPPPSDDHDPGELESYVRAAMHQDRRPGTVLVVIHPLRRYKVPRGLLEALGDEGFDVHVVETDPDRVRSVTRIRDALVEHGQGDEPLDLIVISGDGSLDHHVLVAAYWAFYPDLVTYRPGRIACEPTDDDLAGLPEAYRRAFLDPLPDPSVHEPDLATVQAVWHLRDRLEGMLDKGRSVARIERRADRPASDPLLRIAVLSMLLPHRVTLRAHGFDLAGLASASQERTFQGLYPYVRSIACYPAGTAADNALYAGTPGWAYAQMSRVLTRLPFLDGLRQWLEQRAIDRFVEFFTSTAVVVPARLSLIAFDGDWQIISSHAAGGPGGGRFFSADLSSKTRGVTGYLLRIPQVLLQEGIFGSTVVRIRARGVDGGLKSVTEQPMAEGLYTNRTFIAAVGSVPSTNPTSFAGQASLVVVPPIWSRDDGDRPRIDLSGVLTFVEGMVKGILARSLHMVGLGVRTLAGGGKFGMARPEHQITVTEGEEIDIEYLTRQRQPKWVPTQVSGDPFQATRMTIRVAWGPIPLLADEGSLLMSSALRSLTALRMEQSYRLRSVYIGGLRYFRHLIGPDWTDEMSERTGLVEPPLYLPRNLAAAQARLLDRWGQLDLGEFVDTSERGLQLGRRGRYAHNNDQTAHLVVVREPRGGLLVRQIHLDAETEQVYETRTSYRALGPTWIVHDSQTRCWSAGDDPRILQEVHWFRSAEAFRTEAPTFFPFIARPGEVALPEVTEEAEP